MTCFSVHGCNLSVKTTSQELDAFIGEYYASFLASGEQKHDIEIDISVHSYSLFSRAALKTERPKAQFGDTVFLDQKKKHYRFSQLGLDVSLEEREGKLIVQALFQPERLRHWLDFVLNGSRRLTKYYHRFITKTVVHDLLFTWLAERKKIFLLHGTAVSNGAETFVFAGLGGGGKSTLAGAFFKEGWEILSDNYVLFHGDTLFVFPEKPRITADSEALLGLQSGEKADGIKQYLNAKIPEKREYSITKLFVVSHGDSFVLDRLSSEAACDLLSNVNDSTHEFPQHGNLALLSLITGYQTAEARMEELRTLTKSTAVFLLTATSNIGETMERIKHA